MSRGGLAERQLGRVHLPVRLPDGHGHGTDLGLVADADLLVRRNGGHWRKKDDIWVFCPIYIIINFRLQMSQGIPFLTLVRDWRPAWLLHEGALLPLLVDPVVVLCQALQVHVLGVEEPLHQGVHEASAVFLAWSV